MTNHYDILENHDTGMLHVRCSPRVEFHSRQAAKKHATYLEDVHTAAEQQKDPVPIPYKQGELDGAVAYGVAKDGYWGYEHTYWAVDDWQYAVRNGNTRESYHQWVSRRKQAL